MSKRNKNFDLYGCYVANKIGYSDNYEFCLNYCRIESDIDYICLFEKEKDKYNMNNVCLSYYVYDDYFDKPDGLYNAIIYKDNKLLEEYKEFLSQFKYVICIDYSTYIGLAKYIIIGQIAKARIVCQWINDNVEGCTCIPNITFSFEEYDDICLEGIVKGSAVAISLEGCLKKKLLRQRLDDIIPKVVDRIKPQCILIYNVSAKTDIYSIFQYAVDNNIRLIIPKTLMGERNKILLEKKYG